MQGKRRTVVFLSRFSEKRQRAFAPVDLSEEEEIILSSLVVVADGIGTRLWGKHLVWSAWC
jgi:hypothetical protein